MERRALLSPMRALMVGLAVGLLSGLIGCRGTAPAPPTLPAKHKTELDQLLIRSDVKLPANHPLLRDLNELRHEIADTLALPMQKQDVTVYLFADEVRYANYIQARYPNLPARRAYFVGTPRELAVFTFWGEKIQEDLRHEYTHGVLHASLKDVPLWLDEGLAEYFEVTSRPTGLNRDYADRLARQFAQGWRPDLKRLESLTEVSDMRKGDYQEAWAWVHFLLHHSDETHAILLAYLGELRTNAKPNPMSDTLSAIVPKFEERFAAHAGTLASGFVQVGAKELAKE